MNRPRSHPPLPPPPESLQPPPRADRTQLLALRRRARELGIPASYGREHRLNRVREPQTLAFAGYDVYQRPQWLAPRAAQAWQQLRHAAARGQIELQLVSAFRSVEYQVGLIERKIARGQDLAQILAVSAAPGYSEHHSGRALDLTTPGYAVLEEEFEQSPAFRWLVHNAKEFGFRLSFPRGNPHGIAYEPWHWCWHARR